jgi:hypothetical protein
MRTSVIALAAALVAAAALAVAPVAQARLSARLYATTHHPKAGKNWPIRITAHNGRKRVCGKVRYAFLFRGRVVGRRHPGVGSRFCGTFRDPRVVWPRRAVGIPLTFRAVVDTRVGKANLDYSVRVRR